MSENFGLIKTRRQLTRPAVYATYQQAVAKQDQPTALQSLADQCSQLIGNVARAAMQERNTEHAGRMFASVKALEAAYFILNSPVDET
jgi:hypothetical protein